MNTATRGDVPTTVGAYRILAPLGRGGMSHVFLALQRKHPSFNKLLVVKVLRPDLAMEAEFLSMFMNEARVAAQLNHPNVIQTYEVGEHEQVPYIAMEYLEGSSFATLLKRAGTTGVPLAVQLKILTDMLTGLHYAHEALDLSGQALALVHRDISPENVYVTFGGVSKVLDFGIAKVIDSMTLTRSGTIKGKMGYMAPEQLRGESIDRRADVFAAGVMLWETLAGRRLVQRGDSEPAVIHRRVMGSEPRVTEVNAGAPSGLVAICEKAMALSPKDRFQTADEMREALQKFRKVHADADTREVSALIENLLADERSKLRRIIEDRIKDDAPPASLSDVGQSGVRATTDSGDTLRLSSGLNTPARARLRSRALALAAGVFVLLCVGAFVLYRLQQGGAVPPAPSSVAAQRPAEVNVLVSVSPVRAAVLVDGEAVPNPWQAHVVRSDGAHRITASADGYKGEERVVSFDSDQTLVMELAPLPPPPGAAPPLPSASPPAIRFVPTEGERVTKGSKKRKVDTEDPYQ